MNSKDGQVCSVCILQFSQLLSKTVCSQNINKQIVNIADENLTDYSFLSRYHYTKSKNYLKSDIEFVTEFPCLLGHPVFQQHDGKYHFLWIYQKSLIFFVKHFIISGGTIYKANKGTSKIRYGARNGFGGTRPRADMRNGRYCTTSSVTRAWADTRNCRYGTIIN